MSDDVSRIAAAAAAHADQGEEVAAVLPVEVASGERLYLCAFRREGVGPSWLALDDDGLPVTSRSRVRDAASIAALCEVAEESAEVPADGEPRVASLTYLDSVGGTASIVALAGALQSAVPAVEELARDVESNYKLQLD